MLENTSNRPPTAITPAVENLHQTGGQFMLATMTEPTNCKTLPLEDWLHALCSERYKFVPNSPVSGQRPLPATWRFDDRRADDHIVWLMLNGACSGSVCGKPVTLLPGNLLWMPVRALHTFAVQGSTTIRLIHMRFRLLDGDIDLLPADEFLVQRDATLLREN